MKATMTLVLVLSTLAACLAHAETGSGQMSRQQAGLYGTALYRAGNYQQAIAYLRAAVSGQQMPNTINGLELSTQYLVPTQESAFVRVLANAYWETHQGPKALTLVSDYLGKDKSQIWRCRIAEKNRFYGYAAKCYRSLGETERARRVVREQALDAGPS